MCAVLPLSIVPSKVTYEFSRSCFEDRLTAVGRKLIEETAETVIRNSLICSCERRSIRLGD